MKSDPDRYAEHNPGGKYRTEADDSVDKGPLFRFLLGGMVVFYGGIAAWAIWG